MRFRLEAETLDDDEEGKRGLEAEMQIATTRVISALNTTNDDWRVHDDVLLKRHRLGQDIGGYKARKVFVRKRKGN